MATIEEDIKKVIEAIKAKFKDPQAVKTEIEKMVPLPHVVINNVIERVEEDLVEDLANQIMTDYSRHLKEAVLPVIHQMMEDRKAEIAKRVADGLQRSMLGMVDTMFRNLEVNLRNSSNISDLVS